MQHRGEECSYRPVMRRRTRLTKQVLGHLGCEVPCFPQESLGGSKFLRLAVIYFKVESQSLGQGSSRQAHSA